MATNKTASVSIVIPVYNEADALDLCLQAISRQTVRPLEVIVVDNNSTDNSVEVASRYAFARLVRETKQGVVHARSRGYDAARGEIIGRIDADTLLPDTWVAQIERIFADASVAATSGSLHFYDIAVAKVVDGVDYALRGWMARHMGDRIFLLGSNMAIRRSAWQAVRPHTCSEGPMHEDLDLAAHLGIGGHRVTYSPELVANVSARRIDVSLPALCRYMAISPRTYARHHLSERWLMYPMISIIFVHYALLRIWFRGFDEDAQQFSWQALMESQSAARVDPGLFGLE